MFRKNSALFLILFIVALYLLTNKAVIPFVTKVVESDVFFEKAEEDEELGSIKNDRTDLAFTHCKSAFKQEYELSDAADLSTNQYEAWALGNKTYLVRSTVHVPEGNQGVVEKKYACKIQLIGNDGSDPGSWKIAGIDFNE